MIKKAVKELFKTRGKLILALIELKNQYLSSEGWNLSVLLNVPVDKDGIEIPWFTYSSIHFLTNKIEREYSVFEYGSGNSTIWFSERVNSIVSVEHDDNWYSQMKEKFSAYSNIDYKFKNINSNEYSGEILNYKGEFNIIVIDGRERVKCSMNSIKALKDDGVIIWDNSDRINYQEGYDFLLANSFKRLDFWGIGPINSYSWCTSIFYRKENCLKI